MKRVACGLFLLFLTWSVGVAREPTAAEASRAPAGTEIQFVDRVTEIQRSPKGTLFINFGGKYPAELLTVVIMKATRSRFPGVENWTGRVVRVRGEISEHRGFRRVILRERGQIAALGRPPSSRRVLD